MLSLNFQKKYLPEAGCDEAGRGCLAGPVFAAAVILPQKFKHPLLNDSKQMSEPNRYLLRDYILEHALAWSVAQIEVEKIDEINILNASILAMHEALNGLKNPPSFIIVDGNRFKPYKNIPYQTIVKGDEKYLSIAAASVLAKTFRDDYMLQLHEEHPQYHWKKNKGYGTLLHREAIIKNGINIHHRKSFTLIPAQLEFELA